jgi:hypothetical protein
MKRAFYSQPETDADKLGQEIQALPDLAQVLLGSEVTYQQVNISLLENLIVALAHRSPVVEILQRVIKRVLHSDALGRLVRRHEPSADTFHLLVSIRSDYHAILTASAKAADLLAGKPLKNFADLMPEILSAIGLRCAGCANVFSSSNQPLNGLLHDRFVFLCKSCKENCGAE